MASFVSSPEAKPEVKAVGSLKGHVSLDWMKVKSKSGRDTEKAAVFEDDAQNGPDHVDAHRTVGLLISPWVKRGVVDSTMYTTSSFVRTMELILGL
jgi:hypothetical protein